MSLRKYPNVLEALTNSVWAIEPKYFKKFRSILMSRIDIEKIMSEQNDESENEVIFDNQKQNKPLYAVIGNENQAAQLLDNAESLPSGKAIVLVIPMIGSMFKRANLLTMMSGGVSMESVGKIIQEANQDPNITGILLDMDTPGGTVSGTEYLGDIVFNSVKPVVAYGNGLIASAGEWIASQARETIISGNTAEVGSIGVLTVHTDESGWMQQMGMIDTIVTADGSEDKVVAPYTKPLDAIEEEKLKAELNPIRKMFIDAVVRGRGSKIKDIEKVTTGKMFYGKDAVKFGLADSIGTFDDALKAVVRIARKENKLNNSTQANSNQNSHNMKNTFKAIFGFIFGKTAEKPEEKITAETLEATIEMTATKEEILAAQVEMQGIQKNVSDLTADKDALIKKVGELEQAVTDKSNELQIATNAKTEAENKLATAERGAVDELKAEHETALKTATDENERLTSEATAKDETIQTLTTAKESAEQELTTVRAEVTEKDSLISELTECNKKLAEKTGQPIFVKKENQVEDTDTKKDEVLPKDPLKRIQFIQNKTKKILEAQAEEKTASKK